MERVERAQKVRRAQERADAYTNSVNTHPIVMSYRRAWEWVPHPEPGADPKRYYGELANYLRVLPERGHAALVDAKRQLAELLGCAEHEAARWILTGRGPIPGPEWDITPAGQILWRGLESVPPREAERMQSRMRRALGVRTGRGAGRATIEDLAQGKRQTGRNPGRDAKRKRVVILRPAVDPAAVEAYRQEAVKVVGEAVTDRVNRALALELTPQDLAVLAPLMPSRPPEVRARDLHDEGVSHEDIAVLVGVSREQVEVWLGLTPAMEASPEPPAGTAHDHRDGAPDAGTRGD